MAPLVECFPCKQQWINHAWWCITAFQALRLKQENQEFKDIISSGGLVIGGISRVEETDQV